MKILDAFGRGWGALLLVGVLSAAPSARARTLKIKVGTLAPEGSTWHAGLKRIGDAWRKLSDGKVRLKIYPGGVAGDEGDMIRKMRIGQLHAGSLTGVGLGRITRATMALQIPMQIESYEELDFVRTKLKDKIADELRAQGFVVLNWGDAGWVHFFTKTPMPKATDVAGRKIFVWSGDPEAERAWRALDMRPVPMSATDVLSALQTGLIDCVGTTPLYALASQWFGIAKHMVKVPWAPLNGATVVTVKQWAKVPDALKAKLLAVAEKEGLATNEKVRALGEEAISAMVARGLSVHTPTGAELVAWRGLAQKAYPEIRGKVIPAPLFDEVEALKKAYRAQSPR